MKGNLPPVCIKRLYPDHVIEHDKVLYNTNNHYNEEGIDKPDDYEEKISQGMTKNWVLEFHKFYHVFYFRDPSDLRWMKEAAKIGMITGAFSHMYDDELNDLCEKYEHLFPEGVWFVRSDRVSLKEGMHGVGPYTDFRSMIQSALSSGHGHLTINPEDTELTLYLLPWIEIDEDKEFRIFVHNNCITAISSQHVYEINEWMNTLTDKDITSLVHKIITYFNSNIRRKMEYMGDYTMDLALVGPDETPYFIEPNSFGKYYAAGSALYHWIYDHDTLYESDTVELRYCNEY